VENSCWDDAEDGAGDKIVSFRNSIILSSGDDKILMLIIY
jgi:hypothetical protein